jgi:hypothetical protein
VSRALTRLLVPPVVIGAFALVAVFISDNPFSTESHVEEALVNLPNLRYNVPGPRATELLLVAGGVELCTPSKKDPEIEGLEVKETEKAVIANASVRIYEGDGICEVHIGGVDFTAHLDRPLGNRLVVNESRGFRRVIWSPTRRDQVQRALRYNPIDAERAVLARYPGTHKQDCVRFGIRLFACTTRYPGKERIFLQAVVDPAGTLRVQHEKKSEEPNFPVTATPAE